MILEETLNKFVRDVTNLIIGETGFAIRGNQKDSPRPNCSYAYVSFLTDELIGWEEFDIEDELNSTQVKISSSGMRSVTMTIGFYRDNSTDNARKFRQGLIRESIKTLFTQASIGLTSRSQVTRTPEAYENGWEESAQLEIVLNVIGTDEDIVESIGSVTIPTEVQYPSHINNFDIEVS